MRRNVSRPVNEWRVCVIGSGTRFLSGISVYTCRLANAMAASHRTSVILMQRLLPARLYPGRSRVGASLARLDYAAGIRVFDGVDWFWVPSLFRAIAFLVAERPSVVIYQWWSGTVLHTYLALAIIARLLGARVIIEFHEILDPGEARLFFVGGYVRLVAPLLMRLAAGFAVHSSQDQALVERHYGLAQRPISVLPHGPHDHYWSGTVPPTPRRDAPPTCCNLLFFGTIRPYKGLEDLLAVFDELPEDVAETYWLTVVGETWEGWTLPAELIARSRYRERITFVNRYIHDEEVAGYFAGADAVVLPYRRSSLSGPLHVAMAFGLPIVISDVGGQAEALAGYQGAILIPPADHDALRAAVSDVAKLRGRRFVHPHTWEDTAVAYDHFFQRLLEEPGPRRVNLPAEPAA
jgi:glycosyltransferase involved in cell wall biosynthesis